MNTTQTQVRSTEEALKLALEALKIAFEQTCSVGRPKDWQQIHEAITASKEALAQPEQICGFDVVIDESMPPNTFKLAQPEQEPVAWCEQSELDWLNSDKRGASAYIKTMLSKRKDALAQTALYTTPPQRTWEGLSVFEINDLVENTEYEDYRGLVERTEAKLKEKNTRNGGCL